MLTSSGFPECRVIKLSNELADVWIAGEKERRSDYSYGGTRLIDSAATDSDVVGILLDLATYESGIKNSLINSALANGSCQDLSERLPEGFERSRVAGGRCVIRPRSKTLQTIMSDPSNVHFESHMRSLLADIGSALNSEKGAIKLTPDFGKFAGVADLLNEHTPNVLGVRCELGGCGGKSSYTVSGIYTVFELTQARAERSERVTSIGSAGTLGSGLLQFLSKLQGLDIALCDIKYDKSSDADKPEPYPILASTPGTFTDPCLMRGGIMVATTFGDELRRSKRELIPAGSVLLLAHNAALPSGQPGIDLAERLEAKGVFVVPGQILTLGGAVVARLEWFWRLSKPGIPFDKDLAHRVVTKVTNWSFTAALNRAEAEHVSLYQALLEISARG